jgi:hypothetical protein
MTRRTWRPALTTAAAAGMLGALTVSTAAVAVPPRNDNYMLSRRLNLPGTTLPFRTPIKDSAYDTSEATVQADILNPDNQGQPDAGGPPEPVTCKGVTFGKTVWYDFYPPQRGQVRIAAVGGFDSVIALYRFQLGAPQLMTQVACVNEDAGLSEELFANVEGGQAYTVQIGGVDRGMGPASGLLQLEFDIFPNRDGDALNDDVDDCPRLAGPGRQGCPPRIQAGVDLRLVSRSAAGIRIASLTVRARRATRIELRCRRRCNAREVRSSQPARFTSLNGRLLPNGASFEIRATGPGAIGGYARFDVQGGDVRRVNRCLRPGSRRPSRACT